MVFDNNDNNNQNLALTEMQEKEFDFLENTENLVGDILTEQDPKKLKDLTYLFNMTQTKKSILRALNYNDLLDKVEVQMKERLSKRADQFSNKDLLDYMDKISSAMDKAQKQIKDVDTTPTIQINQQNIVMENSSEISRESRQKILNVINKILNNVEDSSQPIIEEEDVFMYNVDDNNDENKIDLNNTISKLIEEEENI